MIQVKNSTFGLTKKAKALASKEQPIRKIITKEINRGRLEHRILELYKPNGKEFDEWSNLNRIITIRRIRKDSSKQTDGTHYYITSLKTNNAKQLLEIIRQHWWVENKLHWVKDVIMGEDSTKFDTNDRFKMNSLYRNVAFNCLKLSGHKSIKYGKEKCANDVGKCLELLRT